jgi:hypothetical protein
MSPHGTNRILGDFRGSVANEGKADIAATRHFGREVINTLIKLDAGDSFALMRQRTRINGEKRWT